MSHRTRAVCALLLSVIVVGCSGGAARPSRPRSNASLEIVFPAPNASIPSPVDVMLRLSGARLVPGTQNGGKLRGDEGHIHVSVDGQLVAMPFRTEVRIPSLRPGLHTIETEFVASDHLPFDNRIVAAVTFRVR